MPFIVWGQQGGSVIIFGDRFLTLDHDRRMGMKIKLDIPRVKVEQNKAL